MTTGIWSAASGAVGRALDLDVSANNIANATTPGFRADRAVFLQVMARANDANVAAQAQRQAVVRSVEPDLGVGQLSHTGRALDVALRDPATFFAVSTPGGERYTRAGSIHVDPNGALVTQQGAVYLDAERQPLRVSPDAETVAIGPDGQILIDGEPAGGRLLTVQFQNPDRLEKEGNVLMRAGQAAGQPTVADANLEVETLELSNASALKTMTTLVDTTRQFEMLTRVIEAFSTMDEQAASNVMKGR